MADPSEVDRMMSSSMDMSSSSSNKYKKRRGNSGYYNGIPYKTPFTRKFALGLGLAFQGGKGLLHSVPFKQKVKKYSKGFGIAFAVIYVIAFIITIPFKIVLAILSLGDDLDDSGMSSFGLACGIVQMMTPWMIVIMNAMSRHSMESIFFAQLQQTYPESGRALMQLKPESGVKQLGRQMKKTGYTVVLGIALWIASTILGSWVKSIASAAVSVLICKHVFGYNHVFVPVAVLMLIPGEYYGSLPIPMVLDALLHACLAARSLSKDLLEPYTSRVKQALKSCPGDHFMSISSSSDCMAAKLRKKDAPLFLGFCMPWALLMHIPLVGPLVVIPAQAATSVLVAVLCKCDYEESQYEHSHKPSRKSHS